MGAGAHASAGAHVGASLHVVVPRSTCNVQPSTSTLLPHPLAPLASRLSPHPPSPRPSPQTLEVRRSPPARAYTPVRVHMSAPTSTLSSHVQRATCNLQPLAPHPLAPLASSPRASSSLASPLSPNPRGRAESPGAGIHASASAHVGTHLHVVIPRSTCNVQPSTPHASRLNNSPADPSRRRGSPPGRHTR